MYKFNENIEILNKNNQKLKDIVSQKNKENKSLKLKHAIQLFAIVQFL